MIELLPCPFCGREVTLETDVNANLTTFKCPEDSPCIGSGLGVFAMGAKEGTAIATWNRRAALTAPPHSYTICTHDPTHH